MLRKNESSILYTEEQIANRLAELAHEIATDYQGKQLVLVGILKGAIVLIADLQRALYKAGFHTTELSFITVKSYFSGKTSSRDPKIIQDVDFDPKDKHVLVVDDIFDTGMTLTYITEVMKERKAASVAGMVLLDKPARHEVDSLPKYIGFSIPNVWTEGYGMDSAEKGRGNPDIIIKDA